MTGVTPGDRSAVRDRPSGSSGAGGPYPEGMTAARDPQPTPPRPVPTAPAAALDFDDPFDRPSRDDTDHGWGDERPPDPAGDLARFLAEKPPHHG